MKLRRRKGHEEVVELNITAFMNLMVILVPFLLITAVFSRMTVLELQLPGLNSGEQTSETPKELMFQLVVRKDEFVFQEEGLGTLFQLERKHESADFLTLQQYLMQIKERYPDKKDLVLMLDSDITYETIIATMDRIKSVDQVIVGSVVNYELFPEVSIADAQPREQGVAP